MDLIRDLLNPEKLLAMFGPYAYVGLCAVIFAETGLLVGFFLPGDSLLITAGIFAHAGDKGLSLWALNLLLIPMAIIGDAVGYWIGKRSGPALFQREDSRLFKKKHLIATQEFYDRHGGKTIVIARFMPFARTFAPVVAGIAGMPYHRFAMFNIAGGIGWVLSMTTIGYFLADLFPSLTKRIELIIIVVVFLSILPGLIAWARAWLAARRAPAT